MTKPKLLFLAHLLPWPLEGGGQIKSYHTLRLLASRFDVTLLAFIRREEEVAHADALRPLCAGGIETVLLPRSRWRDVRAAAHALFFGGSILGLRDFIPAMCVAVDAALEPGRFYAVHADHLFMMSFLPPDCPVPVALDQHNVEHRIPAQMAAVASPLGRWLMRREARALRALESYCCERADRVLAVSEEDARAFRDLLGPGGAGKVRVTPIGVDTDYFASAPRLLGADRAGTPEPTRVENPRLGGDASRAERPPGAGDRENRSISAPGGCSAEGHPDAGFQPAGHGRDILTVGTMYWPPNVDGARWFCAEVLPRVRERIPDARFVIAGARPSRAVRALAGAGVTVTGTLPDVRPVMAGCGVFVAPLRAGSGVRVKILNALAMGLPVVSTTLGAEGIAVTDGEDILLADTPDAFADAVARVLADPALAARLGRAGRELAVRRYAWEVVGQELLRVYEELGVFAERAE